VARARHRWHGVCGKRVQSKSAEEDVCGAEQAARYWWRRAQCGAANNATLPLVTRMFLPGQISAELFAGYVIPGHAPDSEVQRKTNDT
jgi:hypothetical protein